ncbi:unnamed protein product, partial [Symbiodinium pilosum]
SDVYNFLCRASSWKWIYKHQAHRHHLLWRHQCCTVRFVSFPLAFAPLAPLCAGPPCHPQ